MGSHPALQQCVHNVSSAVGGSGLSEVRLASSQDVQGGEARTCEAGESPAVSATLYVELEHPRSIAGDQHLQRC